MQPSHRFAIGAWFNQRNTGPEMYGDTLYKHGLEYYPKGS